MEQKRFHGHYYNGLSFINLFLMKIIRNIHIIICVLLLFSCCSRNNLKNNKNINRIQYVNYLNNYWGSGDISYIDSAIEINTLILKSDSAIAIDYLYRVQMLYLSGLYDSILSFVNRIPTDLISWPPEYISYLRLKCKAYIAKETNDTLYYKKNLDSIIMIWMPLIQDSISKTDSLLSISTDDIFDCHGHLLDAYTRYYEILYLLHGKDYVKQILFTKKKKYNWTDESYKMILDDIIGDADLALP